MSTFTFRSLHFPHNGRLLLERFIFFGCFDDLREYHTFYLPLRLGVFAFSLSTLQYRLLPAKSLFRYLWVFLSRCT